IRGAVPKVCLGQPLLSGSDRIGWKLLPARLAAETTGDGDRRLAPTVLLEPCKPRLGRSPLRMTHWWVTLLLQRPARGSPSDSTGGYQKLVTAHNAASCDDAGAALAAGTACEGDHASNLARHAPFSRISCTWRKTASRMRRTASG